MPPTDNTGAPTIAVLLGASNYSECSLFDSDAIYKSCDYVQSYFQDGETLEISDTLNLFNSPLSSTEQILEVGSFIRDHYTKAKGELLTICLAYFGHGFFRDGARSFFWATAKTNDDNLAATSIDVKTLGESIHSLGENLRLFGFVDCCFAGATEDIWLNAGADNGLPVTHMTAANNAIGDRRGVSLICSSSRDEVSHITRDETMTVFGASLKAVLEEQGSSTGERLSSIELAQRIHEHNRADRTMADQAPHVLSPKQGDGNLSTEKFFPFWKPKISPDSELLPDSKSTPRITGGNSPGESLSDADKAQIARLLLDAREFEPILKSELAASAITSPLYAIKSRVKSEARMEQKILDRRSNEETRDYGVDSVTDVLGVRLITLFQDEMFDVAKSLAKFLSNESGQIRLPPAKVEECKLYVANGLNRSAARYQNLSSNLFETLASSGLSEEPRPSDREDYSSVHIVAKYPILDEDGSVKSTQPVEFQVRTVLEDTWAEIDHRLRYSRDRSKNDGQRRNISVGSEAQLKVLKSLLDAVAELSDVIQRDESAKVNTATNRLIPVDALEVFDILSEKFGKLDSRWQRTIDELRQLLVRKSELDTRYGNELKKTELKRDMNLVRRVKNQYGVLAEDLSSSFGLLRSISRAELPFDDPDSIDAFAYYFIRMEEAFCRQATGNVHEEQLSETIYQDLVDALPNFPMPIFRLGQVKSKLAKYAEAADCFVEAKKLIADTEITKSGIVPTISLSNQQFRYLMEFGDRLLGYQYWRQADERLKSASGFDDHVVMDEVRELYLKAIEATLGGLEHASQEGRRKYLNNAGYYLKDFALVSSEGDILSDPRLPDREWVVNTVNDLREWVKSPEGEADVHLMDTLAHLCVLLERSEEAHSYAKRVVDLISQRNSREHDAAESPENYARMLRDCRFIENSGGISLPPVEFFMTEVQPMV